MDGLSTFLFEKRQSQSDFYPKLPRLLTLLLREHKLSLIVTKPLLFARCVQEADDLTYNSSREHLGTNWTKIVAYRILLSMVGQAKSSTDENETVVWVRGRFYPAHVDRKHLDSHSLQFNMCLQRGGPQVQAVQFEPPEMVEIE